MYCAAHLLAEGEPFAFILPDVLVKPQKGSRDCDLWNMVHRWQVEEAAQIMVEAVREEEVQRYGIVDCRGVEPAAGESVAM